MNTELLKARQTKYAAYATVYVLVVLTAVVIVNVLADRYNKSYDGTPTSAIAFPSRRRRSSRA